METTLVKSLHNTVILVLYPFMVTYLSSQEIVGSSDGMDVPCQVKVEVIHGDDLNLKNY